MSNRKSLGTGLGGGRMAGLLRPPPVAPTMTFPILDAEEIVVALGEMGIALTEDDIIKCRQDALKNVFDQLIMLVLNVTSDELYQAKFAGLAAVEENSELHEESVHVVHWLRAMNKLLAAAGMPEGYNIKDLIKPERQKVQKALSGIINLQKFRESVQDEYDAHVQKTADLLAERKALDDEAEALRAELATIRALREAEKPEIAAVEAEIAALTVTRNALATKGEGLRATGTEQKQAAAALIEDIRKLESQIAGVHAETEARRGQIVSSPGRVKDDLDTAQRAVEAAQAELAAAEDDRRALTRRLEIVRKAEKDVGKALALLGELEAEMGRLKTLNKAVKQRAAERASAESELASLQATTRQLEESIRSKDERLAALRSEFDSATGSADRTSVALRQELSSLQQQLAEARQARADAELRKRELEEAKERGVASHAADMADMTASVKALQEAVSKYHASLFKKVSEVSAASATASAKARAAAASAAAATGAGETG